MYREIITVNCQLIILFSSETFKMNYILRRIGKGVAAGSADKLNIVRSEARKI